MQCPACKSNLLKPTKLEQGLPAMVCVKCNGHLVNLLNYREWAENTFVKLSKESSVTISTNNSEKALICTKCSKIMHKYDVSAEHDNKVDLCTHCDEAWLDSGEWALLNHLQLHNKLADIFTQPWQSNLRKEAANKRYQDEYRDLLGVENYQKVSEFKTWLDAHDKKFEVLNFLRN